MNKNYLLIGGLSVAVLAAGTGGIIAYQLYKDNSAREEENAKLACENDLLRVQLAHVKPNVRNLSQEYMKMKKEYDILAKQYESVLLSNKQKEREMSELEKQVRALRDQLSHNQTAPATSPIQNINGPSVTGVSYLIERGIINEVSFVLHYLSDAEVATLEKIIDKKVSHRLHKIRDDKEGKLVFSYNTLLHDPREVAGSAWLRISIEKEGYDCFSADIKVSLPQNGELSFLQYLKKELFLDEEFCQYTESIQNYIK